MAEATFKWIQPAEATVLLTNRRVVLMGDSLMFHSFLHLACLLQQDHSVGSDQWYWSSNTSSEDKHFKWQNDASNITLEVFLGGRQYFRSRGNWRGGYSLPDIIPQVLRELRPQDVLQVNAGLHDNSLKQMTDNGHSGQRKVLERGKYQTQEITLVAAALAKAVDERRLGSAGLPKVFWRETTPQHWSTRDGTYPAGYPELVGMACAPLNMTLWEQANLRNRLTNPIVQNASIPVLHVWESLAGLHDMHCPGDCTHFGPDVNQFLVQLLLNSI